MSRKRIGSRGQKDDKHLGSHWSIVFKLVCIILWVIIRNTYMVFVMFLKGFPGCSASKEFTFNAGDPSSIPGSGRSTGKGIDCPLQCSWASLVSQLIKNPPAI